MHFSKERYNVSSTVIKFLLVGVINTAVFYLSFILFLRLEINYLVASSMGYSIAVIISYLLNKIWAFESKEATTLLLFVQFVVVNLISLAANLTVLYILVDIIQLNVYISQLFAISISTVVNFIGYKWVFLVKTYT